MRCNLTLTGWLIFQSKKRIRMKIAGERLMLHFAALCFLMFDFHGSSFFLYISSSVLCILVLVAL